MSTAVLTGCLHLAFQTAAVVMATALPYEGDCSASEGLQCSVPLEVSVLVGLAFISGRLIFKCFSFVNLSMLMGDLLSGEFVIKWSQKLSLIVGFDQVNNMEITCCGSRIRKEDLVTSVRMTCRCQGVKQSSNNFTV